jgi:preprotein translocase subunit SecD
MRSRWLAGLLVFVLAAGCSSEVAGTPAATPDSDTSVGPVDLAVPVAMRPVLESGTGTTTLPGPDGEQLALAEPFLTLRELKGARAEIEPTTGSWVLRIDMTADDGKVFGDWTTAHQGERVAMVAGDEVLTAPAIQSPITGGELQIAGDFTRDSVSDLLARITGR